MTTIPRGWESVDTSIPDDEIVGFDDEGGDDSPVEFDYDDWVTGDGCIFRHHGKGTVVLDATDLTDSEAKRLAARIMRKNQFWPNVWYVSDHGNVSEFTF